LAADDLAGVDTDFLDVQRQGVDPTTGLG